MSKLKYYLFFVIVFYTIHFLLVKNLPFFWDNILFSSKIPYYFFENGLLNFTIDEKLDAGHPPLWSWLIALSWKLFGKNLIVGHLFMLPILIFNGILFLKIVENYCSNYMLPALLLFLFEPTYLAQSTMVSLEIALITGCLLMWYALIKNNMWLLVIASILLPLISQRGAILVFAFFIFHLYYEYGNKKFFQILKLYFPTAMVFLLYYLIHYLKTGYLWQSENSGWSSKIHVSSFKLAYYKLIYVFKRFIDFGRLSIILCNLVLLFVFIKKFKFRDKKLNQILIFFASILFLLGTASMIINIATMHRYYLFLYVIFIIMFYYLCDRLIAKKYIYTLSILIFTSYILGNTIVYNDNISQGWDASLAHLPFFKLKEKMFNYIHHNKINNNEIVSEFPLINGFYFSDLKGERNDLINFNKKTFKNYRYFLHSNVVNDINLKFVNEVKQNYKLLYSVEDCGVYLNLYQKK